MAIGGPHYDCRLFEFVAGVVSSNGKAKGRAYEPERHDPEVLNQASTAGFG